MCILNYMLPMIPKDYLACLNRAHLRVLFALGFLGAVLSLPSCTSTLGEAFTKVETPSPNKALIYVYRPSLGSVGFMYDIPVSANGKQIVTLPHNTYYPYLTDPGEIEFTNKFSLGSSESLTFYAKGGQTYFLKTEIRAGFVGHSILALVEQSTGEDEIRDCRKVPEENIVH